MDTIVISISTPETASYLMLGLGATALLSTLYIVTLFVRMRNLRQDLHLIEEIGREDA